MFRRFAPGTSVGFLGLSPRAARFPKVNSGAAMGSSTPAGATTTTTGSSPSTRSDEAIVMTPKNIQGKPFTGPVLDTLQDVAKQRGFYSPYWVPLQRIKQMGIGVKPNAFFYKVDLGNTTLVNAQETTDPEAIAAIARFNGDQSSSSGSGVPPTGSGSDSQQQLPVVNYQTYRPRSVEGFARKHGAEQMKAAAQTHGFRSNVWLTKGQLEGLGLTLVNPSAVGVAVTKQKSAKSKETVTDVYYNAEQSSDPELVNNYSAKSKPSNVKRNAPDAPMTAFGFAHTLPHADYMRDHMKRNGFSSVYYVTVRQGQSAGTSLLATEAQNGVETELKGNPVVFFNAEQFADPLRIDPKLVLKARPKEQKPPATSSPSSGEAKESLAAASTHKEPLEAVSKSQRTTTTPPSSPAAKSTPPMPSPDQPLAVAGGRFPPAIDPILKKEIANLKSTVPNLSPYWMTKLEAVYFGTEVLHDATGVRVPSTGNRNEDLEYATNNNNSSDGVELFNAAQTVDPSKFNPSTCTSQSRFAAVGKFISQRPLDVMGKAHRGDAAAAMAAAVAEHNFSSRYWITFEEAEAFDVAVYPDPVIVAVSARWGRDAGRAIVQYINADETTDPSLFSPELCRPFFPVSDSGSFWSPKVRIMLHPHHFKNGYTSLVYYTADTLSSSKFKLKDESQEGLLVDIGTFDKPQNIILYNEEQLTVKKKK